ncbi:ATP-binding protein [Weissella confusa]|uniref:ATPase n=1 Tax=Weissella confusa TaxID=1583 RepID=A0A4Z0RYK8_WEICO|nr:ATP-binding protein [Weissella confusa]TGE75311.1 ATPase [Weissella confusa]
MVDIQLTSEFSTPADDLLRQHLLITGATGSGKSTSAVTILHGLLATNQSAIIIDPTGEYTTLPNAVVAKLGRNAFIDYERLTGAELAGFFGATGSEEIEKVADAWQSLKLQMNVVKQPGIYGKVGREWAVHEQLLGKLYHYPQPADMTLLPAQLQQEFAVPVDDFDLIGQEIDHEAFRKLLPIVRRMTRLVADSRFQKLMNLPQRDRDASVAMRTDVMYLMQLFSTQRSSHKFLVIDVSDYADDLGLGKVIVSLLMTALLRLNQTLPNTLPVTVLIDEAHRYLSEADLASDGIFRVAREGRKAGLYLMLTTQSPLDLPAQLLGQFGNYLIHRLNTMSDVANLPSLVPIAKRIAEQGVGEAILSGINYVPAHELHVMMIPEMQHRTASPRFF